VANATHISFFVRLSVESQLNKHSTLTTTWADAEIISEGVPARARGNQRNAEDHRLLFVTVANIYGWIPSPTRKISVFSGNINA